MVFRVAYNCMVGCVVYKTDKELVLWTMMKRVEGEMCWTMRPNFRIPSEEELRRMVTPENVWFFSFSLGNGAAAQYDQSC
jgi:hypothetical protein